MAAIKDVARLAGVSLSTVSKYLNNPSNLTDPYKKKVEAAIKELNYSPSRVARSMRTGKTNMIALVVPEITNPYYSQIYSAIHTACSQINYTPVLYTTEENMDLLDFCLNNINESIVDGVILCFLDEEGVDSKLNELESHLPIVLMSGDTSNNKFNTIIVDLFDAFLRATNYIIGLGHEKIAFISGISTSKISLEKYAGFEKAMQNASLPICEDYISFGKYRFSEGYNACSNFMRLKAPPTAIVAANDILAVGCIKYLLHHGYNVPNDVAVIGFDGIQLAYMYNPAVTTIAQPIDEMSEMAVKMLINKISQPNSKNRQVIFKTQLVVQNSTDKNAPVIIDV